MSRASHLWLFAQLPSIQPLDFIFMHFFYHHVINCHKLHSLPWHKLIGSPWSQLNFLLESFTRKEADVHRAMFISGGLWETIPPPPCYQVVLRAHFCAGVRAGVSFHSWLRVILSFSPPISCPYDLFQLQDSNSVSNLSYASDLSNFYHKISAD